MENEILTIEEVAKILKVSLRTVYDWAQKGELPGGKIGTSWRFSKREIENWIARKLTPRIPDDTRTAANSIDRLIRPERIVFLRTSSKQDALNALIDINASLPGIRSRDELAQAVFNREKLMSTGVGTGLAVPHVRLNGVTDVYASLGICAVPVADYESLDNLPVSLIVFIVAGRNQHSEYIKALAGISRILKEQSAKDDLLRCSDPQAAYTILLNAQRSL